MEGSRLTEVEEIRVDFPILRKRRERDNKPCIYLDNTATSLKPRQVIDGIVDYYENHCANVHRGVYRLAQEASKLYEEAHDVVARFIGAENRTQMIFVKNATEAINYIAYGIDWKPGDTVITSIMEHHSNIVPWHLIRERFGVKIKHLGLRDNWYLDTDQLEELIDDKTRLVTITHVSNVLGTINPIEKICKIAHDHKALCLIDAAQSVPHMPVDVKKIGCDFLVFSAHKMLGPTGIGGLYIREGIAEELCPTLGGGEMIRDVTMESSEWNIMPWKFEAGTPNIAGGIGFRAAIDYLDKLGMKWVRNHEKELTKYLLERLKEIPKIEIYGPQDVEERGGVVAFNVERLDAHDVATFLDEIENIAVRSGLHCAQPLHKTLGIQRTVRASVYVYNTKEEIEKLCDTLKAISEELA
ncbi:MAG: aminotransferase class V-fold PLP-dependent enzyme [Candidatus Hodarchaeota archaeon]